MNNIESSTRAGFFPNSKTAQNEKATQNQGVQQSVMKRNDYGRTKELNQLTADDAKVQINDAIKDFSRIKRAVDSAPEVDNSDKIAQLRQQVQAGTYSVDYEALADRILQSEF